MQRPARFEEKYEFTEKISNKKLKGTIIVQETSIMPRRYLVPFGPKRTPHFFTDILVIGGGIAGLRAALAVPPALQVLVVTKDVVQQSNSAYAQGGIAGVMSTEDRFENHVEDTLRAGAGLCDRPVVEMVVREAPDQINDLIRWGTHFDEEDGHLALTREGGHSHRRIVHALGDATGHEVMRAIIARAQQTPNLTLWEKTFTIDLLTHEGACVGALVDRPSREPFLVWAKQTVLAAAGDGVSRNDQPPVLRQQHGAAYARGGLHDMEFMQFHPTVFYVAGSSRFHQRGGGAKGLYGATRTASLHARKKTRAELAPRDIVSWPSSAVWSAIRQLPRLDAPGFAGSAPLSRHCQGLQGLWAGCYSRPDSGQPGAPYMMVA